MDSFEKYFNKALRFLSFRPRSEKEVRDNLVRSSAKKRQEISTDVIEKIIKRLKELKFVNDKEFTRWWIEQRSGARPKSARIIEMELKQKGIDRDLIEETVNNAELSVISDLEKAKRLTEKQVQKYSKLSPVEQRQKLGQFLARHGFDWETIKQAIDDVLTKGV